jgi:dTMP kinase
MNGVFDFSPILSHKQCLLASFILQLLLKQSIFLLALYGKSFMLKSFSHVVECKSRSFMPKQANRGVFICVEGLDGSGKTTQAKVLVRNLRRRGFDAVYTTEPSAGEVGKLIRSFVLDREDRVPVALEALLFAADRVDHVENVVKPLLKEGKVVVCDRYIYSTLAYQGAAGLDLEWIEHVNRFALKPNLGLLIDVPSDVVVKRLKRKKTVMENKRNQERVREVYFKMVQDRCLMLIDGNRTIHEIAKNILEIVLGSLNAKHCL